MKCRTSLHRPHIYYYRLLLHCSAKLNAQLFSLLVGSKNHSMSSYFFSKTSKFEKRIPITSAWIKMKLLVRNKFPCIPALFQCIVWRYSLNVSCTNSTVWSFNVIKNRKLRCYCMVSISVCVSDCCAYWKFVYLRQPIHLDIELWTNCSILKNVTDPRVILLGKRNTLVPSSYRGFIMSFQPQL